MLKCAFEASLVSLPQMYDNIITFPKVHWRILEDSGRFLASIPRGLEGSGRFLARIPRGLEG